MTAPLGILAGNGIYPQQLAEEIVRTRRLVVVGLKGHCDIQWFQENSITYETHFLGSFRSISHAFLSRGVTTVFFAGGVNRRTAWRYLRPDRHGLQLLFGALTHGDNTFLTNTAKCFAKLGIEIGDPAPWLGSLLATKGPIAGPIPSKKVLHEMAIGWEHAKQLGARDIGQGVIVHKGRVIEKENRRGTDALIQRAYPGSILVKVVKPNQDRRFDLPAVGPWTITKCAKQGITHIGVESGGVLLLNQKEIISACEKFQVALLGLTPEICHNSSTHISCSSLVSF